MNSKSTIYVLLTIGMLSMAAALVGLFQGQSLTDQIIPLICGTTLFWYSFELRKKVKKEE